MSITNNYNVFSVFNEIVSEIKSFYVTKQSLLFATTTGDSCTHYNVVKKETKTIKFDAISINNNNSENYCIEKFVCSIDHFMALDSNGHVYSWGWNSFGQLGNGNVKYHCDQPKLIIDLYDKVVTEICCGKTHSLVLTSDGDVLAFGANIWGQCGQQCKNDRVKPVNVDLAKVSAISCGKWHSVALIKDSGEVFGWGLNDAGQLGIDNGTNWFRFRSRCRHTVPIQLSVPKIRQIKCGMNFTVMLSYEGDVYFCGEINGCLAYRKPTQLNGTIKFTEIAATIHSELCVAVSEGNRCFIIGKFNAHPNSVFVLDWHQTEFQTIDDTYAHYEQITHKTVTILADD